MEKTYEDLVLEYYKKLSPEDMVRLTKLTSNFIEKPYNKEEFLADIEDEFCYFLSYREAKKCVDKMENDDPKLPRGQKWSKEETLEAFESAGYPIENTRYSENGVYYACNMVYSDFYNMYKDDIAKYIEHAYYFLNDKDYKGKFSKEKWYARK